MSCKPTKVAILIFWWAVAVQIYPHIRIRAVALKSRKKKRKLNGRLSKVTG